MVLLITIMLFITSPPHTPTKYRYTLTRCYDDDGLLDECGSIIVVLPFKDEMVVAGWWSFE